MDKCFPTLNISLVLNEEFSQCYLWHNNLWSKATSSTSGLCTDFRLELFIEMQFHNHYDVVLIACIYKQLKISCISADGVTFSLVLILQQFCDNWVATISLSVNF